MLRSWLTLSVRHARKYVLFTFVNTLSLSIGLACCLAILLYVQDELSYESFHEKKELIYRITTTTKFNNIENSYSRTPVPLRQHVKKEVPGIENIGRLTVREAGVAVHDKRIKALETNFYCADPEVLDIFTFVFIEGDAQHALHDLKSVIITERIAKKYFNSALNSIGKVITVENRIDLTVTGVIKDLPLNTHLRPEMLTHFDNYFALESEAIRDYLQQDWMYTSVFTYLLAEPTAQVQDIERSINNIRDKYADERVQDGVRYRMQALNDIRLRSSFSYENNPGMLYIYIFAGTGILILVIACFNFINLSVARALRRTKEIGMKKAMGIDRKVLTGQLLGESFLYVALALLLSVALLWAALPAINGLTEKQLQVSNVFTPVAIATIGAIIILTGLLSGSYPAFYISGINISRALKGQNTASPGKFQLRKVLVVLQFSIAMCLILFTIMVNRQVKFMQEQPLGFDRDHMVTIPMFSESFNAIIASQVTADYRRRMIAFEDAVLGNSNIQAITCSSFLPGQGAVPALIQTDSVTAESNVFVPLVSVDYDFIPSYGINLLAGRNFSNVSGTDHLQAFIINEEAVSTLGFRTAENAIGKRLAAVGKEGQVVGVISNYHIQGLQYPLQPLVLEVASKFTTFSVKINPSMVQESIAFLKDEWDKAFPESIFEYRFLDEELAENYQREERLGKVISYFSLFTYVIAGLGLFGLAVYINQQRVKEVSIRKVLGATSRSVFLTLSSEFMKLTGIAFLIAAALATWLIHEWLDRFSFKATMDVGMFVIVLAGSFFVAMITVMYQTLKTSQTNPAEVLKTE